MQGRNLGLRFSFHFIDKRAEERYRQVRRELFARWKEKNIKWEEKVENGRIALYTSETIVEDFRRFGII